MYVKLKIFSFKLPYEATFGFIRKVKLKVRNIILIPTSIKFLFYIFFFFLLILPIVLSFSLSLLRSSNSQTFSNSRTLKLSVLYRSDSATPELKTDTDESGDEISNMGHDRLVRRSNFDKVGGVVVYRRSSSSCGSLSSSMIFIFIADLHHQSILGLVVVWFFFFFFFLAVGYGCHIEVVVGGVVVEVDVAGQKVFVGGCSWLAVTGLCIDRFVVFF